MKDILNLNEVGIKDIDLAGGKNASLGEMITNLEGLGVKVPGGFVITVSAYEKFIKYNALERFIADTLGKYKVNDLEQLKQCGSIIRERICEGLFPKELTEAIIENYLNLSALYQTDGLDVAVRSSATAEDLPDASFAGQQETYLNVRGTDDLLLAIRKCFASLFTDRALSYRQSFGYDHFQIGLSVCIQKMVRSDLGSSGVAFSIDTESGFKDVTIINGAFGLGELVVQGAVSPDEFIVFKPTLNKGYAAIIEKKLGVKDKKMVYGTGADKVKIVPTSEAERTAFCLSDDHIIKLAKWVTIIEDYYTKLKGYWSPMDVEWAVDGLTNSLFIVQARPETIHSRKDADSMVSYHIDGADKNEPLVKGIAVGDKIGSGRVKIVPDLLHDLSKINFAKGDVLVTEMTDPDWEPIMKIASAIVTEKGGRTCHAAIVARELGIPAIVACKDATRILKDKDLVTVSCAEGEVGMVYPGQLPVQKTEVNLSSMPQIKTPVMLNVASPDKAFQFATMPHKGIGLARLEFIVNNYIKVHPLALMNFQNLADEKLAKTIKEIIAGYSSGADYFVAKLSHGIAKIAASCYPRQVIVRLSDFKSNEYAGLLGGSNYEPKEENPMIGWRGASRYYSTDYKAAFGLECKAIKNVREVMGLDNVVVMIPFCRTVDELKKVYAVMEENGLRRDKAGLQVYIMAELPSNFMMAEEFASHVDGFSIGSNDLTQLVLGLDRDSAQVAHLYDERSEAVKRLILMLINEAKKKGIKVGICGQGPSDFPDFAQFLVEAGIDTISVTPDSFYKTITAIAEIEKIIENGELKAG